MIFEGRIWKDPNWRGFGNFEVLLVGGWLTFCMLQDVGSVEDLLFKIMDG